VVGKNKTRQTINNKQKSINKAQGNQKKVKNKKAAGI